MTELPQPPSHRQWIPESEPLARASDGAELRDALRKFRSGEWDEGQWTSFRLRYGIYGQLQPGVQMTRIKMPGGRVKFSDARAVAAINREFARGDVHLTTRQAFQIYYVPTDRVADMVDTMADLGITSREACGNTIRNFTACALSGVCPREHVNATDVADQLARAWLRHPLVQNMPRKFKATISGCATDCGASGIHDLGLIAVEKDGRQGFRVLAGGGTGGQPIAAVEVLDFVTEDALPAVIEAAVRLHQKYSNRINRNAARLKFLQKRFGSEKFVALFREEFERVRAMPQRPWAKLDWRTPAEAPEPATPHGIFEQHDGKTSVVVSPALGLLSADQLESLADLAEGAGAEEMRATRDQNIAIVGLPNEAVEETVAAVRALGLPVQDNIGDEPALISCPGTTTCRIGITNSQDFGRELQELARQYEAKKNVTIRISGCQNGCGLHHVADFGFRGMGKKVDGTPAPHYQIYLGGNDREVGAIGLSGPIVPAKHAKEALKLLMDGYANTRLEGESVRNWAERLGRDGLDGLLAPLAAKGQDDIYVDWGKAEAFSTPAATKAECATPIANDALYRNLADDALINVDRALYAGLAERVVEHGRTGVEYALRRLLNHFGQATEESDDVAKLLAWTRQTFFDNPDVIQALDALVDAEDKAALSRNGELDRYREALATFLDVVDMVTAEPVDLGSFDAGALGDSAGGVAAMIQATQNRLAGE